MTRARAVVAVAALIGALGCRQPVATDVLRPTRGPIVESFVEPARTRLEKIHVVVMPVTARLGWIDLEPGSEVALEQPLALAGPTSPGGIDVRPLELAVDEATAQLAELEAGPRPEERAVAAAELAEAQARLADLVEPGGRASEVAMADAERKSAVAELSAARVQEGLARSELDRQTRLFQTPQRIASRQALDEAEAAWSGAVARSAAAAAKVERAERQVAMIGASARRQLIAAAEAVRDRATHRLALLEQGPRIEEKQRARAVLDRARHELALAHLRSPLAGIVLARHQRGAAVVTAGTPLLERAAVRALDVVAEVLTEDALRLSPGTTAVELSADALVTGTGAAPYRGTVRRIEPAGFTKLSTLGVEEQRVRVVISFDAGPPPGLGVGFRLQARFVTRSKPEALLVPRYSVLERPDGRRVVLVVENGILVERPVTLGLESERTVEVTSGLDAERAIVATPSSDMLPGTAVTERAAVVSGNG